MQESESSFLVSQQRRV